MLFKKTVLSWEDLFLFTLDHISDSDDEFLKNTHTDAFTISLEAAYSHWKNGKMRIDLGNAFKRPSPGKRSPAVKFIHEELFIWDFSSLYAYFKNPCCSPWLELKKESRRSKKNHANKALWLEFAKHVKENCVKCRRRTDRIEQVENRE